MSLFFPLAAALIVSDMPAYTSSNIATTTAPATRTDWDRPRTNYVLHSGDFDNVAWDNDTDRVGVDVAPDGTRASIRAPGQLCQWVSTLSQPGEYSWSVYAKGDAYIYAVDEFGWWLSPWWNTTRTVTVPYAWTRLTAHFRAGNAQTVKVCVTTNRNSALWGAQMDAR